MSSTSAIRPVGLGTRQDSVPTSLDAGEQRWTMIALVASIAAVIAVYFNTLTLTKDYWSDDTYSHGWIIPFLALFLMWAQRNPRGGPISHDQENKNLMAVGIPIAAAVGFYFMGLPAFAWAAYTAAVMVAVGIVFYFHEFEPVAMWERWIGVGIIIAAQAIRVWGTYHDMMPLDRYSFILSLFGVFILAAGLPLVQRMWASIGFFVFMMPLPSLIERRALLGLQRMAAMASTTVLQILGVGAYREGSRITVDGVGEVLEVAGACSGLRMLTIFCAMVIAMVLLIERPWWDKLILLLSAIPISLATNVIRITATAMLFRMVEGSPMQEVYHQRIHDVAGYAMIFIAGGMMWLEYKVLSWLFVEEGDEVLQASGFRGGVPVGRN